MSEGAHWLRVVLLAALVAVTQISIGWGQEPPPSPETRTWTSTDGRVMEAKLLGLNGLMVQFELPGGQHASVPLARLSQPDQDFIKAQAAAHPLTNQGKSSTLGTGDGRSWPDYVEMDPHALDIKAVEAVPASRRYVYRSESFQFISQDKLADSVIKDVARVFEATRALVRALPWGINPHPPADLGYYVAKLYETRGDYITAGGPANSGGVYFSRDRVFMIPFPSLGLEVRGKTWFKKAGFKEETLVHEVTHQMMHDYLPFLPLWVIEGTAEYTRSIPYNYGRFAVKDHERGLREYLKERSSAGNLRPFSEQMSMKREQWNTLAMSSGPQHALYYQSYLLVYYFCHLDGDGKGTRFLRYLDAVGEANGSWEKFFKDPRVDRRADGSFTYPASLTLPPATRTEEFGLGKLDILLDGRSLSQMDAEIAAAYKKLGIKFFN